MKCIAVHTPDGTYDVILGNRIIEEMDCNEIAVQFDRIGIIASQRIIQLHGALLKKLSASLSAKVFPMDDVEENKNYRYAENFFNSLLKEGFSRKSLIIGVGGGVVGDFAGFCAALYMRGIPIMHVPTTLLAMVDSSIGGKVAVNIGAGKNIVGAFHQPCNVIDDIQFLRTLPYDEMKNGIVETVKHALIGEMRLLPLLESNDFHSILKEDILEEMIYLSASFKATIVSQDVRESNTRSILNFGHTVGHALESWMQYKMISHGTAVALGMKVETEISRRMGFLNDHDAKRINELLQRYDLLDNSLRFDPQGIAAHMKFDKKNIKNSLRLVLLKKIGEPLYNVEVSEELVIDVLTDLSVV